MVAGDLRVDWNAELVRGTWGKPFGGSSGSQGLELRLVGRQEFRSGAVTLRYQPSRVTDPVVAP
jgi:hypothetical protein